jgi:hypothetical protein
MTNHYVVEWRGPFTIDEVIEFEGWEDDDALYAVVHEPPVRESQTLYIGSATKQYIGTRLWGRHHGVRRIRKQKGRRSLRYYLATVRLRVGKRWSRKRVLDIEKAIIYFHGDYLEFNTQNTKTYSGRVLVVTNIGNVPPGIHDFEITE